MCRLSLLSVAAAVLLLGGVVQAARDVTGPLDAVQGVPNDGISTGGGISGWPGNEPPRQAFDDRIDTKFLHFRGEVEPTGVRVTPVAGATVVTGLSFTTANDSEPRDPIKYELSGSNESIDGPYTLIASGDIKDFSQATAWPRRTKNTTPIRFANTISYKHYQVMFPTVREPSNADSMQIAEVELLADVLIANTPNPANGATGVTLPLLQWTPGDTAVLENVYFGTTPELTEANRVATRQSALLKLYFYPPGLASGQKYYWRVDDIDAAGNVHEGDLWSFTSVPLGAYSPSPRDGDKWLDVDVDLNWLPGQGATKHELYFGTDQAAVAARDAGVFKGALNIMTFDPGALAANTTYFWAVDEVGLKKYAGDVWSFTTKGGGGGIKGEYFSNTTLEGLPVLTRIDPEVNFNLAGTASPGGPVPGDGWSARWTADLDIAIADTFTFSVNCKDGTRLWIDGELIIDQWVVPTVTTKYYSLPIPLEKGIHSLVLEYFENSGNAVEQLAWSTPTMVEKIIPAGPLQPPLRAGVLYPENGEPNAPQEIMLRWGAGQAAKEHDIYFGDSRDAVAAATTASTGIYQGRKALDATSFDPGILEWNKTYFWRIDEVNDAGADSPWKGSVWSFTTADFLVVDDFEAYNDEEGTNTRIYETWIDGWADKSSGSTVGNLNPPFAEQTIVHSGTQSMSFDYNNVKSPFYSEAYREFAPVQNWTVNGVSNLTLFVRGNPPRFIDNAGVFTMSAAGADIYGGVDEFRFAYQRLNGNGSITLKVDNVKTVNSWTKAGVMIRSSLDPLAQQAHIVTGAQQSVVEWMYRTITNDPVTTQFNTAGGSTPVPLWLRLTRAGDVFTGEYSLDGKTWSKITQTDGTTSSTTLLMPSSVYIGFVVSSHTVDVVAVAQFSEVKLTGSASGPWQAVDVGVVHPGNDVAPLYVIVEDSTGNKATVTNADMAAVTATDWTEWKIPLSDFAGVNATKVKKLSIGVGDKNPDGTGKIYIDDIRVTKP